MREKILYQVLEQALNNGSVKKDSIDIEDLSKEFKVSTNRVTEIISDIKSMKEKQER